MRPLLHALNVSHVSEPGQRSRFLSEGRVIPFPIIDREADKLAKQQVVVDLFHPLVFTAKGVERHQQLGTQELFRRDGVTAMGSE